MDPNKFIWSVSLYFCKGEYYYYSFTLINCPLLHILVSLYWQVVELNFLC